MIGVMVVNFHEDGKTPLERERLKTKATKGGRRSAQTFKSFIGIGSDAENLFGNRKMALRTEHGLTRVKECMSQDLDSWRKEGEAELSVACLTLAT